MDVYCVSIFENEEILVEYPYEGADFFFDDLKEMNDFVEICLKNNKAMIISKREDSENE